MNGQKTNKEDKNGKGLLLREALFLKVCVYSIKEGKFAICSSSPQNTFIIACKSEG